MERQIRGVQEEIMVLRSETVPDPLAISLKKKELEALKHCFLGVALGKTQKQAETLFGASVKALNALQTFLSDTRFIRLMDAMQNSALDSELVGQIFPLPEAIPFPKIKLKSIYIQQCVLDFLRMKNTLFDTSKQIQNEPFLLHVTGNPGIGKSHLLLLDLIKTLYDNPVERVPNLKTVLILGGPVGYSMQTAYAYTHLTGWYRFATFSDAVEADDTAIDQDTYFFVDTYDLLVAMNHTFSVSSPNEVHFKRFVRLWG